MLQWRNHPEEIRSVRWAPSVPMAPVTAQNPAIVQILVDEGRGRQGAGTGTIFRQEREVAYVLTAAHVVADRIKARGRVVVRTGKQLYRMFADLSGLLNSRHLTYGAKTFFLLSMKT